LGGYCPPSPQRSGRLGTAHHFWRRVGSAPLCLQSERVIELESESARDRSARQPKGGRNYGRRSPASSNGPARRQEIANGEKKSGGGGLAARADPSPARPSPGARLRADVLAFSLYRRPKRRLP